jgi:hypothetical protein
MRNVKVLFALLVVVMATVFIYSCAKDGTEKQSDVLAEDLRTETRAAEPCENALGNCNGTSWTYATAANISIDLYPGCTFEVAYRYRTCPVGKLDVVIDQYGDWPPCAAFQSDYAIDPFIISKVEKKIMTELVEILILLPTIQIMIPNCSAGRIAQIGFSTSSCINFCIIPLGTQTTPIGEFIKVGYVKIPCGEACCKTTYEVCRKANGDIDITPSLSQGTGNCSGQSPNLPCPLNSTGSTGCIPNCYLL